MKPDTASPVQFKLHPVREKEAEENMHMSMLVNSDLILSVSKKLKGSWQLSIFCPYWVVNKTDLILQYFPQSEFLDMFSVRDLAPLFATHLLLVCFVLFCLCRTRRNL